MNVEELKNYQDTLEKKYYKIDKQLEDSSIDLEKREKLESVQDIIDNQLDLLDDIIDGIYEVPRKYNDLLNQKKEYEGLINEYE